MDHLDGLHDAPLGRLVAIAGHVVSQRWSRYLTTQHGLTTAGMAVLFTLLRHGESTHREVADHCYVRPATLTGVIDTLERDGLVERRRDTPDRRTVRLTLTPAGQELGRKISAIVRQNPPLTTVDADPAKAAVIREFLLEVIQQTSAAAENRIPQEERGEEQMSLGARVARQLIDQDLADSERQC